MQDSITETVENFKAWLFNQVQRSVVIRTWIYEHEGKVVEVYTNLLAQDPQYGHLFLVYSAFFLHQENDRKQPLGLTIFDHPGLDQELRKWVTEQCDDFLNHEQAVAVRYGENYVTSTGALCPEVLMSYGALISEMRLHNSGPVTAMARSFVDTALNRLPGFLQEQFRKLANGKRQVLEIVSKM